MINTLGLLFTCLLNIMANHMLLIRRKSIRYSLAIFFLNTLFVFCTGYLANENIQDPITLELTLTFLGFLYIAYICLVFSESAAKKIFTMFSIWVFSFISFFVAVQVVVLFPGIVAVEHIQVFVWVIRLSIQIILMAATYFWLSKPYKKVIRIVPDKIINFMSLYPITAFLLLKTTSFVSFDDSASILVMLLFIVFIILGYIIAFAGICASSTVELQRYMANYDSLTGIANRANIMNQLARTIELSNRSKLKFALFVCDLDDFKKINDEYGHIIGDKALKYAAQAVRKVLRNTDSIGRFGGDEFLIIQQFIKDKSDIEVLIGRIFEELEVPVKINGIEIQIKLSIGVSIYPDDTSDFEALINQADRAMYEAKKREGSTFCFYGMQELSFNGLSELKNCPEAF